jgi:ABC-type molybdate transport system substrate-binding protein
MKRTHLKAPTSLIHLAFASFGVLAVLFLGAPSAKLAAAQNSCVVTVAAASDLPYAMKEIAADFEKSAGCSVRVSYGSDQKVKRPPTVGARLLV